MVAPIGDKDIAILVEGDAPGLAELAGILAGAAAFADKLAVRREDLQPVIAAVGDDDVAVFLDHEPGRVQQFAIAAAGRAELGDVFTAEVSNTEIVLVHSSEQ